MICFDFLFPQKTTNLVLSKYSPYQKKIKNTCAVLEKKKNMLRNGSAHPEILIVFAQRTICQRNHQSCPTTASRIHHFKDVRIRSALRPELIFTMCCDGMLKTHIAMQLNFPNKHSRSAWPAASLGVILKRLVFQKWAFLQLLPAQNKGRGDMKIFIYLMTQGKDEPCCKLGLIKIRRPDVCRCCLLNILLAG